MFDKLFDGSDAHLIDINSLRQKAINNVCIKGHMNKALDAVMASNSPDGTFCVLGVLVEAAIDEALDLQARAQLDHVPEWLSIETAPKDGTYILVANAYGGVWLAKYLPVYTSGFRPENPWSSMMLNHNHLTHEQMRGLPTHWMPLPAPPEGVK